MRAAASCCSGSSLPKHSREAYPGVFLSIRWMRVYRCLAGLQQARLTRAQEMLERLKALLPLNWQALLEETPDWLLAPAHRGAMQRAAGVDSIQQAFSVYLGRWALPMCRAKVSPEDAIQLIERAGGWRYWRTLVRPASVPPARGGAARSEAYHSGTRAT